MSNTQEVSTESQRLIGQVKWFNNKTGFGFITVNEGELSGKDIFTHFSTIRVTNSQYKYLVQGEYVEFELEKATKGDYEFQATSITGIKGGKLMCETRQLNRPQEDGERRPVRRYRLQDDRDRADGDFTKVPQRRQYGGRGGRGGRSAPTTSPVQEQSM
jgi:cold shock CspA family protein